MSKREEDDAIFTIANHLRQIDAESYLRQEIQSLKREIKNRDALLGDRKEVLKSLVSLAKEIMNESNASRKDVDLDKIHELAYKIKQITEINF